MILYRHRQSGALIDISRNTDGTISACQQGGGLALKISDEQLQADFEAVRNLPEFRAGTVTIDCLEDAVFPCYSDGMRWNGFGTPWFDEAGVAQVIAAINCASQDVPTLSWRNGALQIFDQFENAYFDCACEERVVDGRTIKMWRIGDGWVWDKVEFVHDVPEDPSDAPRA
jgi:hypothetical protein